MTFVSPWMLLGALAALIPFLIHLFDRRRPRPHPFAALTFVLRSQKRTASRLKLKRLLLYTLRTLVFLCIPIALARPSCSVPPTAIAAARGPAATSIILDASLSMRWQESGNALFERAKSEAADALAQLAPEEPANFVLCSSTVTEPGAPSFERRALRAAIDNAEAGFGGADLNRCLEVAARSLEESPLPGKRLVVVSDFATHGLRLEAPAPVLKGPKGEAIRPSVELRDVADGLSALSNRAIADLKVDPALQVGPRAYQFTFTVRNHSDEAVKDLEAVLRVKGAVVAKGFVDLPARGAAQKVLTHRFDAPAPSDDPTRASTVTGEVALASDGLSEDDHQPFVVHVPRDLAALVVNGSPNTVRYRDEAFFVESALGAAGSPVRAIFRDVDAAFREDLSLFDVVLLLNVPAPEPEIAARLTEFVERGGGLFISMGDNVDAEAYNARLGSLLPRPLRLAKTAALPDEPDADRRAAKLTHIATEHPVLSPFTGAAGEGLIGARFYRYMLLEAEGRQTGSSEVLGSFEDGAPALAAIRRGEGRVVMLTSTVDREWSDLSIRTSFLPLMQRLCAYLGGALEEHAEVKARVGEPVSFRVPTGVALSAVRTPEDESLELKLQDDGTVTTEPLPEPGVYTPLDAKGDALPELAFAATTPASESDLTRHSEEALSRYFGEESVRTSSDATDDRKVPMWTWLFVAAAMAFALEGTLLRK